MSKIWQTIFWVALLLVSLSTIAFIPRVEYWLLIVVFATAFASYFYLIKRSQNWTIALGVGFLLLSRSVFFFELPLLSEDFYRFIWDGMLLNEGFGAIGNIPSQVDVTKLQNPVFAEGLLQSMNSPDYPSIYPPLHQLLGGAAYYLGADSLLANVNALRAFILIAEAMLLIYVSRRAHSMLKCVWVYLFNPLVIVEGVGNVHIEAILVPLLGIGLIALVRRDMAMGALGWASSVLVKFVPLILAPMVFFRLKWRQRLVFGTVSIVCLLLSFLVFNPMEVLDSFSDGMGIYYGLFEFNASVYYMLRALLTPIFGYNPIAVLAPALALFTLVSIVLLAYFKRKSPLFELALVTYIVYLLTSAIVHPWYLLPVVFLAAFAERRYILIWSFAVMLSYSHYLDPLGPKWVFVFLEYGGLAVAIWLESKKSKWLQSF